MRLAIPILWALLLAGGLLVLWRYEAAPGAAGSAPLHWPAESGLPIRTETTGQYTLLVTLHPHCPCSRATVRELDRLMTRCAGAVHAEVLFVRPQGVPAGWEQTDLWRAAAAIPNASVATDDGGQEAARFGAQTSGQVLLYNPEGRLAFTGGITSSRGHEGDNVGSDTIAAIIRGEARPAAAGSAASGVPSTTVFGCALAGDKPCPNPAEMERSNR
jgi:hypothetical protein